MSVYLNLFIKPVFKFPQQIAGYQVLALLQRPTL